MGSEITSVDLETLNAIQRFKGKTVSEMAAEQGLKLSTFSERTKKLKEQGLIEEKKNGKSKRYYLTEYGLNTLKGANSSASDVVELTDALEYLLQMSFEDAYRFIDSYFEKPFFSVIDDPMHNIPKINLKSDFIKELDQKLRDFICTASSENYTKETFTDKLIPKKHHSNETKGFIYYIANKYEEYQKTKTKT